MKYDPNRHHRRSIRLPGYDYRQPDYYEHIIRNQDAMSNIRQYIINNSLSWSIDKLHPGRPSQW